MIAPVKLNDLVAAGKTTRESQTGHRGFGAAVDHSNFLDGRHPSADQLSHFHFQRVRNSKAHSARRRIAHRINDYFWRMAKDSWAPASNIIDVFPAIDVPDF